MAKDDVLTEDKLLAAWRLRDLRAAAGYSTVAEAATDFGSHASYWCVWETARQALSNTTRKKLIELFQTKIPHEIRHDIFSVPPENWSTVKIDFLEKLRKRANKNKDYYELPDRKPTFHSEPDTIDETFDVILNKITQAAQKYRRGEVSKDTYTKGMKRLREIAELYFQ